METRKLTHEVWQYVPEEGEPCTALCYAGPMGDDLRRELGPTARLITNIEASSHFEAMTKYYRFMGWGKYKNDQPWVHDPYPDEWFQTQTASINGAE